MAEEDTGVSIDEIKLWTVNSLKNFLRERNMKVSGRKEELVALVFAAKSRPDLAPPATSAATANLQKEDHYKSLLKTSFGVLPDPEQLNNWESEATSITKWPPMMSMDIANYLNSIDDVPLRKRLMSDYKEQKAYSYFSSGWMGEVQFHHISRDNKVCFLRTKCSPSQRVNNIPWNVWVAVEKQTGEVMSAFCQCFAGYSSTCNHVAALLFKIDYAWRNGFTNPACTSRECEWSGPSFAARHLVQPRRIRDMNWSKPDCAKQAPTETEGINPPVRRLFSPLGARSMQASSTLESLTEALIEDFPDACVFEYVKPEEPVPDAVTEMEVVTEELPLPLPSLGLGCSSVDEFIAKLPVYAPDNIAKIEEQTRGQATNDQWFAYRKGRITGSIAHAVLTKGRKMVAGDLEADPSNLVKRIIGDNTEALPMNVPAMKYGREMEEEARRVYLKKMKPLHSSFSIRECGLFVDNEKAFLAATPDGLVACKCCGEGALEIKCPYSVSHEAPSEQNLSYLKKTGNGLTLKDTHQYYTQVQMQLGVLKRPWCDFFVYSRHGSVTVRVMFDEERWAEVVRCAELIFKEHVAPKLVKKDTLNKD